MRDDVRRARDSQGRAVRWVDMTNATIRSEDGGPPVFRGEAIVFDEWTWIGSSAYGFFERIAPEAVNGMGQDDVRFLINHDPNLVLGRNTAGTLKLTATESALEVEAELPDTSYARDLAVSLERGDITGMSFAFEILNETPSTRDGKAAYTIDKIRLFDVSAVTYPAYEQTSGGLRAEAFELVCRAAGLDQKAERALLRNLTGADEEIADAVAETARSIAEADPVVVRDESGDEPAVEPDDTASRAGVDPDGDQTADLNPGDRLRDLRGMDLAKTFQKGN